jgi:hypothetical protein
MMHGAARSQMICLGMATASLAKLTVVTVGFAMISTGCKDRKPPEGAQHGADKRTLGSGAVAPVVTGSPKAMAPSADQVCVFAGDVKSQCVDAGAIAAWPRLDTLLPDDARRMGTWKSIAVQTAAGRGPDLMQPTDTYPDMVAALFIGANGKPALGMFDLVELANRGAPKWQQADVKEVHVLVATGSGRGEHDDGNGAVADPTALTLSFTVNGATTKITGRDLLALPRENQPGEEGDAKGWALSSILKSQKINVPARVRLTDAAGVNLVLEKSDFDPQTSIPFVKLNKQGSLRFRVLKKKGEVWIKGADLRALASVELLK